MRYMKRSIMYFALCAMLALGFFGLAPQRALAFPESEQPYWIHVSRTRQIVTVLSTRDNSVVRQMICSTGLPTSPTITGKYKLPKARSGERKNWYAISRGTWVHYATRIKGSYLFHSILYKNAYASSLDRTSWNKLGSRASAGCIRLTPLDAQWIAYNCQAGTQVWINDSAPYGPIKNAREIKKTLPNPTSNGTLPGFEALTGPAPKPEPAVTPTLVVGIEGSRTKTMQGILRSLGYHSGAVNGKFGENTKEALERFQQRYLALNPGAGLVADGKATPQWQTIIKANKSKPAYAATYRTLSLGTSGLSVKVMREKLKSHRYTSASASTKFDERTKSAVANAQRAFGLTVNGKADKALQDKLLSASAKPLPIAAANLKGGLKLRKIASTKGKSVVIVKKGARLAVVKFYGDWSYVTTGKYSGYVISRYLKYEVETEDPAYDPNA